MNPAAHELVPTASADDLRAAAAPRRATAPRPSFGLVSRTGRCFVFGVGAARRGRSRWRLVVLGAEFLGAKAIIGAQMLPP